MRRSSIYPNRYTAAKQAGDECICRISPALYLDPARPFIMEFGWDFRLPVLPYLIAERTVEQDDSGFPLMEYYTQAYRSNLKSSSTAETAWDLIF